MITRDSADGLFVGTHKRHAKNVRINTSKKTIHTREGSCTLYLYGSGIYCNIRRGCVISICVRYCNEVTRSLAHYMPCHRPDSSC